ncbi:MAG: hypothetical protein QUS14_07540 [Pyrinomonadaceae bacterium]|nr:hypothetical protein [Pyrinomonadaceae bacterium]
MRLIFTFILGALVFTGGVTAQDETAKPAIPAAEAVAAADKFKPAVPRPSVEFPDVVPVDKTTLKAFPTPTPTPDAQPASQTSMYTRPDGKTRAKRYFNSMFGPFALARSAATAGIGTWRNSPEEWGPHWEGFGRRFAANVGRSVIRNSVMFGLDEALKVDSHFYRSEKRDTTSKIVNALVSPVTARKPDGKRTIGIPRIVGTYTSSIIAAETFYPARYDYKDGIRTGSISLGFNAAFNLIKEFVWKK